MNGITNEAAKEGHDPIHHVEVDEERLHDHEGEVKGEARSSDAPGATSTERAAGHKESTLDRVKQAFHRQARRAEKGS
ncbi:hypothetical protein N7499_004066 [Penicillium canescens]|nr:hypothetical protein N7522_002952 [Penicillium canescens]KAJ6089219.1 hypothetical protein N7499_004066 [Penicillium canescens]KAJ6181500.1 hypothetical protein N7485_000142 [Penicillium canescens]